MAANLRRQKRKGRKEGRKEGRGRRENGGKRRRGTGLRVQKEPNHQLPRDYHSESDGGGGGGGGDGKSKHSHTVPDPMIMNSTLHQLICSTLKGPALTRRQGQTEGVPALDEGSRSHFVPSGYFGLREHPGSIRAYSSLQRIPGQLFD